MQATYCVHYCAVGERGGSSSSGSDSAAGLADGDHGHKELSDKAWGSGKKKKLTLEERKRLDAEKAKKVTSGKSSAGGSVLSSEELAGLAAGAEAKGDDVDSSNKKGVDMDDFDFDSSSSDSDSDGGDDKPWAKKAKKEEATSEPAVARKRTFEEVRQELQEKKKKAPAAKAEARPTISLISGMTPPPMFTSIRK